MEERSEGAIRSTSTKTAHQAQEVQSAIAFLCAVKRFDDILLLQNFACPNRLIYSHDILPYNATSADVEMS